MKPAEWTKPDYGVDAPAVLRNFFLFGALCLLCGFVGPHELHIGNVAFKLTSMFFGTAVVLLVEALLYLLYVKRGKLKHRDYILPLRLWRGDEAGAGRGLRTRAVARRRGEAFDDWEGDGD